MPITNASYHHTIYDQELGMDWAPLAYARARVFKKRGLSSLQSYQPTTPKSRFQLQPNPNLSQFNPFNQVGVLIRQSHAPFAKRRGRERAKRISRGMPVAESCHPHIVPTPSHYTHHLSFPRKARNLNTPHTPEIPAKVRESRVTGWTRGKRRLTR